MHFQQALMIGLYMGKLYVQYQCPNRLWTLPVLLGSGRFLQRRVVFVVFCSFQEQKLEWIETRYTNR